MRRYAKYRLHSDTNSSNEGSVNAEPEREDEPQEKKSGAIHESDLERAATILA